MKVSKFGGSSLADGHQLQRVFNIVNADSNRKIIVVSAPGKRFTDDIKVTDLLIKYAEATINDQNTETIISDIKQRYHDIAYHFGLPQESLTDIDQQIDHLAKKHYRSFDYLFAAFAAHGEYLNAQLIAKVFTYLGLPARFIDPKKLVY